MLAASSDVLLSAAMYAHLVQGPSYLQRVSLSIKTSSSIVMVRCLQLQVRAHNLHVTCCETGSRMPALLMGLAGKTNADMNSL
jgi:hypothetical protein